MAHWSLTSDSDRRVFRLYMPKRLSTQVAHAALTELVKQLDGVDRPAILIADLRAVRRIDPEAPVVGALICAPVVGKIEHLYIVTDNPVMRSVAAAAAHTIGLPFTCHDEEPDPDASRQVPPDEQP